MGGYFGELGYVYAHTCYQRQLAAELELLKLKSLPIQAPAASELEYYDKPIPEELAIEIAPSSLPAESNITFSSSTYFKTHATLPAPDEIRAAAGWTKEMGRPYAPFPMPSRRLLVKWGPHVDLNEARSMWAIWHYFRGAVPVPELYGWCVDDEDTFIFMELVDGDLAGDVWDNFDSVAKDAFCTQLRQILSTMSRATQGAEGPFIGTISKGYVRDEGWRCFAPGRRLPPFIPCNPFDSVKQFHDYFVYPELRGDTWFHRSTHNDELRAKLPDDIPITLTQNDLHPFNIIVQNQRIVSLLDWQYSGWFPAYWNYCKLWGVGLKEGWKDEVRHKVVEPWDFELIKACGEVSLKNHAW